MQVEAANESVASEMVRVLLDHSIDENMLIAVDVSVLKRR
jgi:hypothetical protein